MIIYFMSSVLILLLNLYMMTFLKILLMSKLSSSTTLSLGSNQQFQDVSASFGSQLNSKGLLGRLASLKLEGFDEFGCDKFDKSNSSNFFSTTPTKSSEYSHLDSIGFIALIKRGNCRFDHKVRQMQMSGAIAVIVGNTDNELVLMHSSDDTSDIHIPSVSTTLENYNKLSKLLEKNGNGTFLIRMYPNSFIDWPILQVVLITLLSPIVLMLLILFAWQINQRRLQRRKLATPQMMGLLKTEQVSVNLLKDKCPICLEFYKSEERLRVLPCLHKYHVDCVDHWLMKINKLCPMCKRDVSISENTPLMLPLH